MSFLSGFIAPVENTNVSQKTKKSSSPMQAGAIFKLAYIFGLFLFLFVISQMLITLFNPVSQDAKMFDVYSRNISSMLCLSFIALFLMRWSFFNAGLSTSKSSFNAFKIISILTAIFCGIKGILSIYYATSLAYRGIYVIIYYAGDVLAWLGISLFFFSYNRLKITKREQSSSLKLFRTFTSVFAIICLLKAATAGLYTMINFVPGKFPWIYYLIDTAAWLILFIFFISYSRSELISLSLQKRQQRDTTSFDDKANNVARTNKDQKHHYRRHSDPFKHHSHTRFHYPEE